jgi:cytochrome c-type biogenesis protein
LLCAGIFSFFSLRLPLIPSYLSFVSGFPRRDALASRARRKVRGRVVLNSLAFILGFSSSFVSLGASASFLGGLFLGYRISFASAAAFSILLVGLISWAPLRSRARSYLSSISRISRGYLGSVLVGITFRCRVDSLRWTDPRRDFSAGQHAGEVGRGTFLLMSYAAGLALPFFLSALAIEFVCAILAKAYALYSSIHVIGGVLLIIVGVLLITDYMTFLNIYVLRFTPNWLLQKL